MNKIDFSEFAKNVADYVGMEPEEVSKEMNLYEDLMMDSLGLFSLGMYLTGIYKLQVPLSSVAVINTVGDMYQLLVEKGEPEK